VAIYPLSEYPDKFNWSSPIQNLTTTRLAALDMLKSTQRGRLTDKVKIRGALLLISIAKMGARGAKSGICSYINILKIIIKKKKRRCENDTKLK